MTERNLIKKWNNYPDDDKEILKSSDALDILIKRNMIDAQMARVLRYAIHYYHVNNVYELFHALNLEDFLRVSGCGMKMFTSVEAIYERYDIPKVHD